MKLTLADSKSLRESVSIISELVNEARFKVSKNSLDLIAMDPANVAMVIFKLLSSAFTEYEVDGEETEFGINLTNLKQVMKRAKPSDIITLELTESKLNVTLRSNVVRKFSLPLINLEEREQKIPELTFSSTIKTSTDLIGESIEDASIIADSLQFETDKEKFKIFAQGDLSNVSVGIEQDEITSIKTDGNVKSKYSIEYLKKIIAGSKITDKVTIQFSNNYPLRVEFKVVDKVLLAFILAPRVDND